MNSEKVKEIKEKLQEEIFIANSFGDKLRKVPTKELENLLTLINELESENERLNKALVDNLEAYKDGFNEGEGLKKGVDDKLKTENQQLKDRIAELENGIAQSMLGCEFLPECTNDKLKQFAERLKEHPIMKTYSLHNACERIPKAIDETLNEFIND